MYGTFASPSSEMDISGMRMSGSVDIWPALTVSRRQGYTYNNLSNETVHFSFFGAEVVCVYYKPTLSVRNFECNVACEIL